MFVSSRRQTRLTALDLIAFAAAADRPRQFVHMSEIEAEASLAGIRVGPYMLLIHSISGCVGASCT